MNYISLLFPIILAFCYRARGGAISLGRTSLSRLIFWAYPVGLICTLIAYLWHMPLWVGASCIVMAFLGACIGHGTEMVKSPIAYMEMGFLTCFMLFLILLQLGLAGHIYIIALTPLGFFGGWFASWLGWRMNIGLRWFGIQWCVPGDSSWEELFIGAFAFGVPLMILGLCI